MKISKKYMNLSDKSDFQRTRGQLGGKLAIAVVIFGLCLSGCNSITNSQPQTNASPSQKREQTQGKKRILTTFTVLADIAQKCCRRKSDR